MAISLELICRFFSGPLLDEARWGRIIERDDSPVGFSLIPNMDRSSRNMRLVTNSLGIRDFRPPHKNPDKTQILVLGDSFTFGYDLNLQDTYSYILELLLNKNSPGGYEVINTAVPAYDTIHEMEFLKKIIPFYSAQWIVVGFCMNDLYTSHPLRRFSFIALSEWLRRKSALYACVYRFSKTTLNRFVRLPDKLRVLNEDIAFTSEQAQRIKKALKEIKKIGKENNADTVLFLTTLLIVPWDSYPYQGIHKAIKEFCEENSIYFVDSFAEFMKYDASSLWVALNDNHYNRKANEIAAGVLYNFFDQTGRNKTDEE